MPIVKLGTMTTEGGVDVTFQMAIPIADEGGIVDYYELVFTKQGAEPYNLMLSPADLDQLSALLKH
jgi:hypothetical protein